MYTKLIENKIRAGIDELSLLKDQYIFKKINKIVYLIKSTIKKKNKIIFCGNGGSASDAQHISAEFVGRFQKNRKALPSIAINSDTAIITALAKIVTLKLCEYYKNKKNKNFISVQPSNLYGVNDNFDLNSSHVIPALITIDGLFFLKKLKVEL